MNGCMTEGNMKLGRSSLKKLIIACGFVLLAGLTLSHADDLETYTHRLSQSTSQLSIWTTPPSERVFQDDGLPTEIESAVKVYAAQNEFEPFQLVIHPSSSGNITVSMNNFGTGITTTLYQVKYITISTPTDNLGKSGPYPDPLWPIEDGESVFVPGGQNSAFWVDIKIDATVAPGDYSANLEVGGVSVPITLHVFNFAIPEEVHVKSQMNFSHRTVLDSYSVPGTGSEYWMYVDNMKQFFIDHRLTPKSVHWPGGVTRGGSFLEPFINYDCNNTLTDPKGIWGFEDLAERYMDGNGLLQGRFSQPFNGGVGFPSFMAGSFNHNDPSSDQRPADFCGLTRSLADWEGTNNPNSAYNQQWKKYVKALSDYLQVHGYRDRTYHYFANEPQDQDDYDAVAWYSQLSKSAAPDLKLMVSEEPKPEIYNNPHYPEAKVDIWLPVLNEYDPTVSHEREVNHNEETWVYFLHGTSPPYFNPITLDHPGIESKLTGWFLWKYRIKGLAYYSLNGWSNNPWTNPMTSGHNGDTFMLYPPSTSNTPIPYGSNNHRLVPSIRLELMRDSLEDYEYLYVLSGNAQPRVNVTNSGDTQVNKIITGLTSYTRNSEFMYNLRRLIGLKNGGEIAEIPDIEPPPLHPRAQGAPGNYYINFQDPDSNPTASPLMVDGHEYMKIGWNDYDQTLGYGWYGDMAHVMYRYLDLGAGGPGVLQQSIIYDDWGRQKTFEFDLPNGRYDVTVSVGWQGRSYESNKIDVEGVSFIDDEQSNPYIVRTKEVMISDNKLTMAMGIFNKYTMLNYMDIKASGPDTAPPVISVSGPNPLNWRLGKSPYWDMGATARDNVDGNLTSRITIDTSEVDVHTLGTYTVYYSVTDNSGNTGYNSRTVNVVEMADPDILLLVIPALQAARDK